MTHTWSLLLWLTLGHTHTPHTPWLDRDEWRVLWRAEGLPA